FLVRNGRIVSSASIRPLSGDAPGLTMARRSLPHNVHAVRYEPRPSWFYSCSARCRWSGVAIKNAAPEPDCNAQFYGEVVTLHEPLSCYRRHGGNLYDQTASKMRASRKNTAAKIARLII